MSPAVLVSQNSLTSGLPGAVLPPALCALDRPARRTTAGTACSSTSRVSSQTRAELYRIGLRKRAKPTDPTVRRVASNYKYDFVHSRYGVRVGTVRGWFATRRGTTRASSPRPYAARRCYQRITYAIPIDPCRHYQQPLAMTTTCRSRRRLTITITLTHMRSLALFVGWGCGREASKGVHRNRAPRGEWHRHCVGVAQLEASPRKDQTATIHTEQLEEDEKQMRARPDREPLAQRDECGCARPPALSGVLEHIRHHSREPHL